MKENNAAQAADKELREAFELTYAADADDPACAADLFHFTNGWRACIMSKLRAPVADERAAFETAMQNRGQNVDRWPNPHGGYRRLSTEIAWYAWNDRAALASAPVAGLPERDATKAAEDQGLFRKFDVRRTDGSDQPGGKHHGCRYFVLDVDHDPHASAALGAYAAACERTHPALASDLREKWGAPLAGEATDGRQALLEAIHRYGNARAMAEHNIAYRDEVRNTADALLALFDAAPQASAEDVRNAALIPQRQEWANRGDGYGHWVDVDEARFAVLAPECRRTLYLPQADKDGGQQRDGGSHENA